MVTRLISFRHSNGVDSLYGFSTQLKTPFDTAFAKVAEALKKSSAYSPISRKSD